MCAALTSRPRIGGAPGQWHIAANENIQRETRHGWCETGADGAVGILTLDEPASLNAMTPDLLGALAAAVAETTEDEDVRALVLTGTGRGFCSGQNLKASERSAKTSPPARP